MADLLVLPRPAKSLQNGAGFSRKTCLLKRKEWPQCHRESSWQVRQSRLCQKEKEQSRQYRVPDREVGETLGEKKQSEKERDQSRSMKRKEWTSK